MLDFWNALAPIVKGLVVCGIVIGIWAIGIVIASRNEANDTACGDIRGVDLVKEERRHQLRVLQGRFRRRKRA
jgi:hypothetical protein